MQGAVAGIGVCTSRGGSGPGANFVRRSPRKQKNCRCCRDLLPPCRCYCA